MVFDCPGQIELYSNTSVFRTFVQYLQTNGWLVCNASCAELLFCGFRNARVSRLAGTPMMPS